MVDKLTSLNKSADEVELEIKKVIGNFFSQPTAILKLAECHSLSKLWHYN
jgi:hypothetical protein